MLTSLRIQNFKAWRDTKEIRLAPLTVIFGTNSSGKSSLGHLLLALKQTALSTDRKRALLLGDSTTLIDLGTFSDCLYNHDLSASLEFELAWNLQKAMSVRNLNYDTTYIGDSLSLKASLVGNKKGQPEIKSFSYELFLADRPVLDVHHFRNGTSKWELKSNYYDFVQAVGRQWQLSEPEKFYRASETSISRYQNAGFLADFALQTEQMLSNLSYLGPLREPPQRIYQWSGDTPEDVGQRGQYAIAAILAAQSEDRHLNRGHKQKVRSFDEFIAAWLKEMGVITEFVVKPVADGRKEFEVLVRTHPYSPEVKITDIGFGVSQVLPALVQAFYCPPNSTVWMEQPEIHLHPQVQSSLADVCISAIRSNEGGNPRNVQLIIESHSEHFLTRLQRRVAEELLKPEEVAVYYCENTDSGSVLKPLEVNLFGEISAWPENFFGDPMGDLTARVMAAARRAEKSKGIS